MMEDGTIRILVDKLEALTDQIDRLNKYNDTQIKKTQSVPPTFQSGGEGSPRLFEDVKPHVGIGAPVERAQPGRGQERLFDTDQIIGRQTFNPEDTWQRYPPNLDQGPQGDWATFKQEYQRYRTQSGQGRFRSALGAFREFGTPNAPDNTPPDLSGSAGGGGMGGGLAGVIPGMTNPLGSAASGDKGLNDQQAITWALLGEHGGPAAVRNMALETYGIRRSLQWAQSASQHLGTYASNNTGVLADLAGGVSSNQTMNAALNLAAEHPLATYGAYKAAQGVGHINDHLKTMQTIGEQFGYGPPPGGRSIFGFRNPLGNFGTATGVGLSFEMEKQALMGRFPGQGFGSGLSKQQATDTLDTLGNQGFGMQPASFTGDAATIAQNFFRPIMTRTPGVTAQDLGQFTGAFRNGAASTQQMADALSDLGTQARITKETIGQVTTSLAQTSQQFESMGSTPQGAVGVATGFTGATGLPSQVAGQIAQNPLFQGMALSQGILPSGLGDLNPGTFAQIGGNEMNMLYHMLKPGLGQDKYATKNGVRSLIQKGDTAVFDQMSRITGIASNQIQRMVGDNSHIGAEGNARQWLGDPNQGTGFFQLLTQHAGKLSNQEYAQAQHVWNTTVADTYQGTGVTKAQMDKINKIPGMRNRANAYKQALDNTTKDDPWNQLQQGPVGQKVSIDLSPEAKKVFRVTSITDDKAVSNAGQDSITQAANSILGWNRTSTSGSGAVAFPRH